MPLSPWQLKRQAAWWIARQKWSEPPQGLVTTGGSLVSEDEPGNFRPGDREVDGPVAIGLQTDGGFQPFVIVTRDNMVWDRESMARIERVALRARVVAGGGFGSLTTAAVAGIDPGAKGNTSAQGYDTHGLNQVTGKLRANPNGQGQSQGRDTDELLDRIAELVGESGFVDSIHAFQGRLSDSPALGTVHGVQVLENDVVIEALNCIASNYYHPPFRLTGSSSSSGGGAPPWNVPPNPTITVNPALNANNWQMAFTLNGMGPASLLFNSGTQTGASLATLINQNFGSGSFGSINFFGGHYLIASAVGNVVTVAVDNGSTTLSIVATQGAGVAGVFTVNPPPSTSTVTLNWIVAPARFDFKYYIVRRGTNPGDPAPTDPVAGGTLVVKTTALTAQASGLTSGQTYNFSVFTAYDETGSGTEERYSVNLSKSVNT